MLRVECPAFVHDLPLTALPGHTANLTRCGNLILSPTALSTDDALFQIAAIEDWLAIPGECRITEFEWKDNRTVIAGSLTHPLATYPNASFQLVGKTNRETLIFLKPRNTYQKGKVLYWSFEFDPVELFNDGNFGSCVFDFDFEINSIHQRLNFGRKRPKGTMALMRSVQPELGSNKLVAIEDKTGAIGFSLCPLVPAKAPKITQIEWLDNSLIISGEFVHPILLQYPNAQLHIRALSPSGDICEVDCSTSPIAKGIISWSATVSPMAFFNSLNQVEGEYRFLYVVNTNQRANGIATMTLVESNSLETNATDLEFPFGVRRPKGTLAKLKAGGFEKNGIGLHPKEYADKSLGFTMAKSGEKPSRPKEQQGSRQNKLRPLIKRILKIARR